MTVSLWICMCTRVCMRMFVHVCVYKHGCLRSMVRAGWLVTTAPSQTESKQTLFACQIVSLLRCGRWVWTRVPRAAPVGILLSLTGWLDRPTKASHLCSPAPWETKIFLLAPTTHQPCFPRPSLQSHSSESSPSALLSAQSAQTDLSQVDSSPNMLQAFFRALRRLIKCT